MRSRLPISILIIIIASFIVVSSLAYWKGSIQIGAENRATRLSGATFPITVTDVRGEKITIAKQPQRIISTAPNNTEILFAIGAGPRVIADTDYCDYPPEAATLPKIGGYLDPNVEKIVSLNPDLVLATRGTSKAILDRMATLKVPAVCLDPESIPETLEAIRTIGAVTGETASAKKLAQALDARRQAVLAKTTPLPAVTRPTTLFLFTAEDLNALYSVGPGSHIDAMIADAGGRNVGAHATTPWPQLSRETVFASDPEVILVLDGSVMSKPITPAEALRRFRANRRWRDVRAVKTGRVAVLDGDALTLPGPRMLDGLEAMAAALHPDLFPIGETK